MMVELVQCGESAIIQHYNQCYQKSAAYLYVCEKQNQIIATCLYDVDWQQGYCLIRQLSSDCRSLGEGLLRAVCFHMMQQGILKAKFDEEISSSWIEQLGLRQQHPWIIDDLGALFKNCTDKKDKDKKSVV